MDVDATQALDFTDDDETDDEMTSQQRKRPVSSHLYHRIIIARTEINHCCM